MGTKRINNMQEKRKPQKIKTMKCPICKHLLSESKPASYLFPWIIDGTMLEVHRCSLKECMFEEKEYE